MSLSAFQAGLGHLVRAGEADKWDSRALSTRERRALRASAASDGLRLTATIQRSWCRQRAAQAAPLTLSVLPIAERTVILDDWVARGGGTQLFFAAETETICDFIASCLPNPSHALTICRFEQATARVAANAAAFVAPAISSLADDGCRLRPGRGAALVPFFAEPSRVLGALAALTGFPPCTAERHWVLFAPGINGLGDPVDEATAELWQRIATPASPTVGKLREAGFADAAIERFVLIGAAELGSEEWIESNA